MIIVKDIVVKHLKLWFQISFDNGEFYANHRNDFDVKGMHVIYRFCRKYGKKILNLIIYVFLIVAGKTYLPLKLSMYELVRK